MTALKDFESTVRKVSKTLGIKPSQVLELVFKHPALKKYQDSADVAGAVLKMKGLGKQKGMGFFGDLGRSFSRLVGVKKGDSGATQFFKGFTSPFRAVFSGVKAIDKGFKDLGVKPSEALNLVGDLKGEEEGKKYKEAAKVGKVFGRGASDVNINKSPNSADNGMVVF